MLTLFIIELKTYDPTIGKLSAVQAVSGIKLIQLYSRLFRGFL